jgi:D-threo-aldose 1-dehydrogenase
MKAATLQFSLAHPQIAAVIPGAKTPDEVAENINLLRADIPLGLWDELTTSGLIVEGCPTPKA